MEAEGSLRPNDTAGEDHDPLFDEDIPAGDNGHRGATDDEDEDSSPQDSPRRHRTPIAETGSPQLSYPQKVSSFSDTAPTSASRPTTQQASTSASETCLRGPHPAPAALKHTYLTLLHPPQLIFLLMALDSDRNTQIFPDDLEAAVASIHKNNPPMPMPPPPPFYPQPPPPPPAAYPPPPQSPGGMWVRSAPPGMKDALPSYEEMIVQALAEMGAPDGTAPKIIFEWMASQWPLLTNFRPSASQALQKAYKRGRLEKIGTKYRLNPRWDGSGTSRRATRRPKSEASKIPMWAEPPPGWRPPQMMPPPPPGPEGQSPVHLAHPPIELHASLLHHQPQHQPTHPPTASPAASQAADNESLGSSELNAQAAQAAATLLHAMQLPLSGLPNRQPRSSSAEEPRPPDPHPPEPDVPKTVAVTAPPSTVTATQTTTTKSALQASLTSLAQQLAKSAALAKQKKVTPT